MPHAQAPWRTHFAPNAALILVSLLLLPVTTYIVLLSYIVQPFSRYYGPRRKVLERPKTILVTGVGMSKGLALARIFYEAGHNVIGADFEPYGIPACGRFSRALKRFYRVPAVQGPHGSAHYAQELLRIARREDVDLWVSCSGVASAVEDGIAKEVIERQSKCRCIQFDVKTTATLHEKDTFIEQTKQLQLPTPDTYNVTSRDAVHNVLNRGEKKKYILKSVGMDDANRGDMTLLPRRTLSQTYDHVAGIPISPKKPWVLQQYVRGKEYCTHALIIKGKVKAFVACPSKDVVLHYEALPAESALNQAMLKFTETFAARSKGGITGHLSFDFLIDEVPTEKGVEMVLQPIECNPRAHTAVILFNGQSTEMTDAYMSALKPEMDGFMEDHEPEMVTPHKPYKYYWIGHDVVALALFPLLQLILGKSTITHCTESWLTFVEHVLFWKDGTFEVWDPLPWLVLNHVYWPGQFLRCILHRQKWSRVNVSTTKMFLC